MGTILPSFFWKTWFGPDILKETKITSIFILKFFVGLAKLYFHGISPNFIKYYMNMVM